MEPKVNGIPHIKFSGIYRTLIDEKIGQFYFSYCEKESSLYLKTIYIRLMWNGLIIVNLIIHANMQHTDDKEFIDFANECIKTKEYSKLIMFCLFRYYNLDDLGVAIKSVSDYGKKDGKRELRREIHNLINDT